MTESWQQLEGQVVDTFPLLRYLAGSEDQAVFLTEYNQRKAAIKLIAGGSPLAERRLRQWRLAAKLSHPHLLQLFAAGSAQLGDLPVVYSVTEFADEDLSQVIPQRPLTTEESREMLKPALSALAYIHSQGFAHGRVKPSNIMAVGTDLKLSSDVDPDTTPAADVRALSLTLLEVLTQRADPALASTLPAPFAEIVSNSLLEEPKSRWTVDTITSRLETPSSQQPQPPSRPSSSPTSPPSSTPSSPPSSPLMIWVWAAVLAAILAAVIVGPKLLNRRPETPAPAPVTQIPEPHAEIPRVTAPTPKPAPAPAGVLHRVLPQVPSKAIHTIHGAVKVAVRVEVGSNGSVTAAKLESAGPSPYFAQFALDAARQWKFSPQSATWIVHFEFKPSGVTATPARVH
jgi:TonB family protein